MASRRRLKKSINLICDELFVDCVALSMCGQGDREQLSVLMTEVLTLRDDYVARLSHTEKGSERLFFKKLRDEFTAKVNDLSERIVNC